MIPVHTQTRASLWTMKSDGQDIIEMRTVNRRQLGTYKPQLNQISLKDALNQPLKYIYGPSLGGGGGSENKDGGRAPKVLIVD